MNPGLKINTANRPVILQEFQSRILNKSLKIKSKRLIRELKTFEYNPLTKKAEAVKGKHDDAIMSLALACHVRNEMIREVPLGVDGNNIQSRVEGLEDIRNELRSSLDSYIKEFVIEKEKTVEDFEHELILQQYRKQHNILKEFGW